jgi:hypothetical protein
MQIYNIVKFFTLAMENNPNIVDTLFVPQRCVTYATQAGELLRENRRMFLHRGAFHKFKGYAYSQMHKMMEKKAEGKRVELIARHGFDTKFAYNVIRLGSEIEQILTEGDLNLEEEGRREHMKAIRNGEVPMADIIEWFNAKEKHLEDLYHKSDLPYGPDEDKIKDLLLQCLTIQYGTVDDGVVITGSAERAMNEIAKIVGSYSRGI